MIDYLNIILCFFIYVTCIFLYVPSRTYILLFLRPVLQTLRSIRTCTLLHIYESKQGSSKTLSKFIYAFVLHVENRMSTWFSPISTCWNVVLLYTFTVVCLCAFSAYRQTKSRVLKKQLWSLSTRFFCISRYSGVRDIYTHLRARA